MKCIVKAVGVIDHDNEIHKVTFKAGLNIVTGKSSTGKSAIIEIFDFCLGNSDNTIPKGVITARSKLYFTILEFDSGLLVLSRDGSSEKLFIRDMGGASLEDVLLGMKNLKDFFKANCYFPLREFKKELGRYFAVTMTDIDEDAGGRDYGAAKASTPSIRSFASYMLQHQNLVANKHALFYRFDEKRKRDQVIEHLKIFMNFVDQQYFWVSQDYNELKAELKKIDNQIPKTKQEKADFTSKVEGLLAEYQVISGTALTSLTAVQIANSPKGSLMKVRDANVRIDSVADSYTIQKKALEEERAKQTVKVRELQDKLFAVRSSISLTEDFASTINNLPVPEYAEVSEAQCPFCDAPNHQVESEANKLTKAIDWMNSELKISSYARESFREEEGKITKKFTEQKEILSGIQSRITRLEKQVEDLKKSKTVDEIALRVKHRLELEIENYSNKPKSELEGTRKIIEAKMAALKPILDGYDVPGKMRDLSDLINSEMARIGAGFDFEPAYMPINLKFDPENFDLWHESDEMGNVYLRSMGSGANWLYSHLTLFLALHSVFAQKHKDGCKIPPILFLDQPTQVYFPAKIDHGQQGFDARALAKLTDRVEQVDEDIGSVTNMFDKLVEFCQETKEATGIMPQIIVTDHADELELSGEADFQSFVRVTWRKRGFIADRPAEVTA
ncbi:DUF3732 domain-containing protein [Pseudomonas chlororaphis]|uniref:DUF3732 domain-containing protein n=1 Tax=Pseudomonas chlororaphis TaxID=587753 RepID=UPI003C1B6529